MSRRGTTGIHRPSILPNGFYASSVEELQSGGFVVQFLGEDERAATFDISTLPLPGWHGALAEAWARRVGPSGELRTHSSATGAWNRLKHFMVHLSKTLDPPRVPSAMRQRHATAYEDKLDHVSEATAAKYLHSVAALFDKKPLAGMISDEVKARFRPRSFDSDAPLGGYSDREYDAIVAAARRDLSALRERLAASAERSTDDSVVREARRTGRVPSDGIPVPQLGDYHRGVAEQLFVTKRDVLSALVLLVALSGWNVETIKELSSSHRVLEGRAVEVQLIKRRRGEGRTEQSRAWEVGRPGRELHNAGGLYLLLLKLMGPARELLEGEPYWAVWAGGGRGGPNGVRDAFSAALNLEESNAEWTGRHDLRVDADVDEQAGVEKTGESEQPARLALNFNRLKTSAEVRRVREMGGHLPSAVRSNTVPVLFRNYLLGDATTLDWAKEEMAESLLDVEQAALDVHRRSLAAMGRTQIQITPVRAQSDPPLDETGWTSCSDHAHHPLTGRRCTQSFLNCFHCANAVISNEHLPKIVALLDALERRRDFMDGAMWWSRYGPTWTAIRYDVLPKFTEGEVEHALTSFVTDSTLDLVEPSWEIP